MYAEVPALYLQDSTSDSVFREGGGGQGRGAGSSAVSYRDV